VDNEVLKLAYDASLRAIADQEGVLEGLRSRAGTLFAAAALVTSFLGGQALAHTTRLAHGSWAGVAIACFVGTSLLTLTILWPFRLRFSLSSQEIIEIVDSRQSSGNPVSAAEAYREIALRLELNYDANLVTIRRLLSAFRVAIVLLVAEVASWIVVLWRM
jgi:hypothetical protein